MEVLHKLHCFSHIKSGSVDTISRKNDQIDFPDFVDLHDLPPPTEPLSHDPMMFSGSSFDDFEHSFDKKSPKIIIKKIKIKQPPKVIYKIKKVYVPKPFPVIKKVKVYKKIKIPVPVKVKYIKIKKIKVPVIKKVKVPVIRKVVKFIPKTKSVKHVHVHKVVVKKGKKEKKKDKKKKKFKKKIKKIIKKIKKKKNKMKKKKIAKLKYSMHDDGCHRRTDCATCPACPAYCFPSNSLPTVLPTVIPGLPPIPPIPPIPGFPFGRRRRDAGSETQTSPSIHDQSLGDMHDDQDPFPTHDNDSDDPSTPDSDQEMMENIGEESQQIVSKRIGIGMKPFYRMKSAAECLELIQPYPLALEELDEDADADDDDETSDGMDGLEQNSLGSFLNPELEIKRRKRREAKLKMRKLDRSLLLGPRIQFFDHEGWAFFGKTIPFHHLSNNSSVT